MARKRKQNADQLGLLEARVATAPCVPAIREKVKAWRDDGYKGVTDTTRLLLNYWFSTDHRLPSGRKFAYHYFQREAVETLIYLYEVAKIRRHKSLVETFATRSDLRLLQYDDFARYCVKMATGSGKTKVMSLAVAWQFFNAVAEARDDFAKTFLLIAPNVIVFERLRTDFEGGRIFRADPVIPPELEIFWRDFQCYMRGEGERASSLGALYLTNIQQFYERPRMHGNEPDEMTAVLGPKPPAQNLAIEDFDKRIVDSRRAGRRAQRRSAPYARRRERMEQDHSQVACDRVRRARRAVRFHRHAAPQQGTIVFVDCFRLSAQTSDHRQCRETAAEGHRQRDRRAAIGHGQHALSGVSGGGRRAVEGIPRAIGPLGKKPVLFVMMNDTDDADDVGDWLQKKYPSEFGGEKLLIIHTDKSGEVSKKDLDKARTDFPRSGRRKKPGQLHRQRDDAARRLGRAERDGDRRPAALHVQGEHSAGADRRARTAPDVPRQHRLHRARRCDRQQDIHRVRGATWSAKKISSSRHSRSATRCSIVTIAPDPKKTTRIFRFRFSARS